MAGPMRPDYKNWVPRGMLWGIGMTALVSLVLLIVVEVTGMGPSGVMHMALAVALALAALICLYGFIVLSRMYRAFDYSGTRQMARQIIEGTAGQLRIVDGGVGLDVGCGSGALTIAVAKRNPRARMVGLDRWGRDYASFSRRLCEDNARAEGVEDNTEFVEGDAIHLDFPDGSFDAVTSNYCYHNITGADKQALLRETLRVLKKGGTFAIHDIMSPRRYGDMHAFVRSLRAAGYEEIRLVDTTRGMFMTPREARSLSLVGSSLLVGRK